MTFRARLASFLVASLVILQLLTALLVYEVTRSQIIREGERQLTLAGATFSRQGKQALAVDLGFRLVSNQPQYSALWRAT